MRLALWVAGIILAVFAGIILLAFYDDEIGHGRRW